MTPNTAIAMTTHTHRISMCSAWMRRLSSVTPTGMFSSQAANTAVGKLARMAASAHLTIFTIDASAPTTGRNSPPRLSMLLKRGRFVRSPHQLFETSGQSAALVFREKPSHFAGQGRRRGVEFNLRPMSRKYQEIFAAPIVAPNGDCLLVAWRSSRGGRSRNQPKLNHQHQFAEE